MTRLSNYLLPTLKDAPGRRRGHLAQADGPRRPRPPARRRDLDLDAGRLPVSVKKVERIIREEMDAIGCHEMLMPVLQPAEPWKKTGRYEIDELFKLRDRKDSELVLAMTHEEAVTTHVAQATSAPTATCP